MSADHHPEIVIVRRRGAIEDEHHGGAWKIAFADFMTAMMAFFLVLWIISATDKNTKTLIARYFNPVKVEEPAKAQKGIHGVDDPSAPSIGGNPVPRGGEKSRPDHGESSLKSACTGRRRGAEERQKQSRLSRSTTGSGEACADHVGGRALQRSADQP